MADESPTEREFAELPLRAIVAYAARCAMRAQYLYRLPVGDFDRDKYREVDHAVRLARIFAASRNPFDKAWSATSLAAYTATTKAAEAAEAAEAVKAVANAAAYAAAHAAAYAVGAAAAGAAYEARAAADAKAAKAAKATAHGDAHAAANAARAAAADVSAQAAEAESEAALADLIWLRSHAEEDSFDVSDDGPMGPLWRRGEPPEVTEGKLHWAEVLGDELRRQVEESQPKPQISVVFDDCGITPDEKVLFFEYLSAVYREHTGAVGLKLVSGDLMVPAGVEVGAGA